MRKVTMMIVALVLILAGCTSNGVEAPAPPDREDSVIPGSSATALERMLKDEFHLEPDERYVSPATQNSMSYYLQKDDGDQIIDFSLYAFYGKTQDNEDFLRDVRELFLACASLDYDSSDAAAATAFIEDGLPSGEGEINADQYSLLKVIGNAKFTLKGERNRAGYTSFQLHIYNPQISIS